MFRKMWLTTSLLLKVLKQAKGVGCTISASRGREVCAGAFYIAR